MSAPSGQKVETEESPEPSRGIPQTREGKRELELLAKIRAGDVAAFEQLYHLYHPRLTRFLWTLTRRPALAEEVLDDTLMVIWHRPDSFHGESKLSTWLFAIAYRKAMRGLRKQDDAVEDLEADRRMSCEAGPDETSRRQSVRKLLSKAIADLSPAHRAVVDLTYFHELGYREIAQILDCPVDTVKTRMFHARRHLRKKLGGVLADWI